MMHRMILAQVWVSLVFLLCFQIISLGDELQISENAASDHNPQIHNGQVVWNAYDRNDWEIFFWDKTGRRSLTNNQEDCRAPQIHNGQVVWQGFDGED
jgi:hypothetical protein